MFHCLGPPSFSSPFSLSPIRGFSATLRRQPAVSLWSEPVNLKANVWRRETGRAVSPQMGSWGCNTLNKLPILCFQGGPSSSQPQGTASDVTISFFLACPAAPSTARNGVANQRRRLGNRHHHSPFPSCLPLSKSLHLSAPSRASTSKELSSESYGG